MIEKLKKVFTYDFIHIIISTTFAKILMFASSIFLPRFLSVDDFGIYTYSENIFNYFLMINGLGLSNSILKFCAKTSSKKEGEMYFTTCLKLGIYFDLVLMILLVCFSSFYEFEFYKSKMLLQWMAGLLPLSFLFESIQLFLRANLCNKKFSWLTSIYALLLLTFQIILIFIFSLDGVIYAKYTALIGSILLGFLLLGKNNIVKLYKHKLVYEKIRELVKYAIIMLLGNFSSLIISLNDTQLIGSILKNSHTIALYKVGTFPLQIMLFFTNAIIVYITPLFIKRANDKRWVKLQYKKIMKINFVICLVIHIIMALFAKEFILVIYKESYLEALPYFYKFLVISFILSVVRNIPGNLLAVLGYEKYNLIVNILTVIIHFLLHTVLLNSYKESAIGIALLISYLFSGILLQIKINKYINRNSDIA